MGSFASHALIITRVNHESLGGFWEGSHVIKVVHWVMYDHWNPYTMDEY